MLAYRQQECAVQFGYTDRTLFFVEIDFSLRWIGENLNRFPENTFDGKMVFVAIETLKFPEPPVADGFCTLKGVDFHAGEIWESRLGQGDLNWLFRYIPQHGCRRGLRQLHAVDEYIRIWRV